MNKAERWTLPPTKKKSREYLATLPTYFFMVIKDFDTHGFKQTDGHFKEGDILVSHIHGRPIRLASASTKTRYSMLGHGMMREYMEQGFVRLLTFQEFLAAIPHMTRRVWRCAGQFELRNRLCAMSPAMEAKWVAQYYWEVGEREP